MNKEITSSARILEQLKQTQRIMLSTVLRKPMWNIGFASSKWPKWPGHSAILAIQVSHFIFRSIVPSLGSLNPLGLGFPLSVVSPCSICTTDICLCKNTQLNTTIRHHKLNLHKYCLREEFENYDLIGTEYAELDHTNFSNLSRRKRKSHIHDCVSNSID